MKRRFLFGMVTLVALTLGSCSNDEVVNDYSQDNAIQFGTYVNRGVNSRGTVVDLGVLKAQNFGVFAYYSHQDDYISGNQFTPNFMNNQKVTWTGEQVSDDNNTTAESLEKGSWTYTPVKYWPNNPGEKVSFIAYAPYDEDLTVEELEDINKGKLLFSVANDINDQIDLLWDKSNNFNLTKQGVDEKVMFKFGHALSRIGLTLDYAADDINKGEGTLDENTTIYVDKVELSGFYIKGKLDLSKAEATWECDESDDNKQTFVLEGNKLTNNIITSDWKNRGKNLLAQKDSKDNYLMVIPMGSPEAAEFSLTVTYRVFTLDDNLPEVENLGKGSLVTNTITTKLNQTFAAGKAFTYNIVLGMTTVKVEASVDEWIGPGDENSWHNENFY